jgi:rubrerythrin
MAEDINEAVQLARKMEIDGEKFYLEAAENSGVPQAQRMFESFARDERRHLRIVEDVSKGLGVDVESMPTPKENIRTVFTEARAEIDADFEVKAGELEALATAMEMETKSYRLYVDAAEKAESEKQKALFERLAEEENQHYVMLENTQEYLESNEKWWLQK